MADGTLPSCLNSQVQDREWLCVIRINLINLYTLIYILPCVHGFSGDGYVLLLFWGDRFLFFLGSWFFAFHCLYALCFP